MRHENGQIFTSPASKLLPSQLEFLKEHKARIIEELSAEQPVTFADDRRHCSECRNLYFGACSVSPSRKFKPLDDLPRRCEDFKEN